MWIDYKHKILNTSVCLKEKKRKFFLQFQMKIEIFDYIQKNRKKEAK